VDYRKNFGTHSNGNKRQIFVAEELTITLSWRIVGLGGKVHNDFQLRIRHETNNIAASIFAAAPSQQRNPARLRHSVETNWIHRS